MGHARTQGWLKRAVGHAPTTVMGRVWRMLMATASAIHASAWGVRMRRHATTIQRPRTRAPVFTQILDSIAMGHRFASKISTTMAP